MPSIVFTTSGVSVKGRAYWGAYAVSKFADEGLMQVLADELATDHAGALQQRQSRRRALTDAGQGVSRAKTRAH